MDDNAPVTGDYPDDPRLPLITVPEVREVARLLRVLAGGSTGGDAVEARILADSLAARIPSQP